MPQPATSTPTPIALARPVPGGSLRSSLAELELALRESVTELQRVQAALSESLAREAQAQLLAWHDPLTGLPNRRGFELSSVSTLARQRASSAVFALLFIDLDDFKSVNDLHGHAVGDELLRVIGQRLVHALRAGDVGSRQGGDEFLCLLPPWRPRCTMPSRRAPSPASSSTAWPHLASWLACTCRCCPASAWPSTRAMATTSPP